MEQTTRVRPVSIAVITATQGYPPHHQGTQPDIVEATFQMRTTQLGMEEGDTLIRLMRRVVGLSLLSEGDPSAQVMKAVTLGLGLELDIAICRITAKATCHSGLLHHTHLTIQTGPALLETLIFMIPHSNLDRKLSSPISHPPLFS